MEIKLDLYKSFPVFTERASTVVDTTHIITVKYRSRNTFGVLVSKL